MPDILESTRTYLKTKSAITSIVGASDASKIFFHDAKLGADPPFIILEIYQGESRENLSTISGVATNRIQIDCYGATASSAYALAEAVRLAPLQMFRGTVGSCTVLNVTSDQSYVRGYDPPSSGSSQKRYWISRDYLITYQESTS